MTDAAALDIGRALTLAEESFSLTALMGDVLKRCRGGGIATRFAFLIPRTEGAEVDGQYSRMLRLKFDEAGFGEAAVVSPFLEDLPDMAAADLEALFLALLAGDVVLAAPLPRREQCLQQLLDLARQDRLDIEALAAVTGSLARAPMPAGKRILAVGEPLVLYNDGLNAFTFQALENQGHRVVWAPLAETLWLFWHDCAAQNDRADRHRPLLDALAGDMARISQCLGHCSPYEHDPQVLAAHADRSVGYYAGAFGRYRAAKVLGDPAHIDGIVTVSSVYENTGVSLNVLHPAFAGPGARPLLNLTFDGHPNTSDANRLEAFIAYLQPKPSRFPETEP